MAFSASYIKRVSAGPALDKTHNSEVGAVSGSPLSMWLYDAGASYANNSTAQVIAANYFDSYSGYLAVGDFILANTNNPAGILLRVATNSGGAVTTTQIV